MTKITFYRDVDNIRYKIVVSKNKLLIEALDPLPEGEKTVWVFRLN